MSRHPHIIDPIPEQTARIARAVFRRGKPLHRMRDAIGTLVTDEAFAPLFPVHGRPATSPWCLALVCVMQYVESLSDRQAADGVTPVWWLFRDLCEGTKRLSHEWRENVPFDLDCAIRLALDIVSLCSTRPYWQKCFTQISEEPVWWLFRGLCKPMLPLQEIRRCSRRAPVAATDQTWHGHTSTV